MPKEYSFESEHNMASRAMKIDPKKSVTSDPNARPGPTETVDEGAIAALAYALWQGRG
jgi:hypothetical protein